MKEDTFGFINHTYEKILDKLPKISVSYKKVMETVDGKQMLIDLVKHFEIDKSFTETKDLNKLLIQSARRDLILRILKLSNMTEAELNQLVAKERLNNGSFHSN